MYTEPINRALGLTNGAQYYRCALQVNCYEYLLRHSKPTPYPDEDSYNEALVAALLKIQIQVIGITDHYRWDHSEKLRKLAEAEGLVVFPGFEAMSSEGVHFLCLFEPGTDPEYLNRTIGHCGVLDGSRPSPSGDLTAIALMERCKSWKCVCIAAHITQNSGLLFHLQGPGRINAWTSPHLVAAAIPGSVEGCPTDKKQILLNNDPAYKRARPVALINAADINDPKDVSQAGAWTWIKMASVSIEGLRQAFLDSESRIRLASDVPPEQHTEILAASFEGGFFDGGAIHFNSNLNTLVGGRGTGKSTVLEAIRYALAIEPEAQDTRKIHEGIVKDVIRSGTKISLLIRTYDPDPCDYIVERTVPNPARVRDATGALLEVTPVDLLGNIEIYGQHEISELARDERRRTRILNRFRDGDDDANTQREELRQKLERSRREILNVHEELEAADAKLSALPGLVETLRRYQDAGLETRLKERTLLIKEEAVVEEFAKRIDALRSLVERTEKSLDLDQGFVSDSELSDLPGKDILQPLAGILEVLDQEVHAAIRSMETALTAAKAGHQAVSEKWNLRKNQVTEEYERILKDLQKDRVDGSEFIRLKQRIEQLRKEETRAKALQIRLSDLIRSRETVVAEWEDFLRKDRLRYDRAARKINRKLISLVKVEVSNQKDREVVLELLRSRVGGRLIEACERLRSLSDFSMLHFAKAIRDGAAALTKDYAIPTSQADRIVQLGGRELPLLIEEIEPPISTRISLNTAAQEESPHWRELEQLSTGQRATAILLVLLLESKSPLLIDQPEDDLDNSFISDRIVRTIRIEKQRRQFIFTTHNANIPVIGDAELIVGLHPAAANDTGQERLLTATMGSIDSAPVRAFVEQILEGGREAFEMRRLKYDF